MRFAEFFSETLQCEAPNKFQSWPLFLVSTCYLKHVFDIQIKDAINSSGNHHSKMQTVVSLTNYPLLKPEACKSQTTEDMLMTNMGNLSCRRCFSVSKTRFKTIKRFLFLLMTCVFWQSNSNTSIKQGYGSESLRL